MNTNVKLYVHIYVYTYLYVHTYKYFIVSGNLPEINNDPVMFYTF